MAKQKRKSSGFQGTGTSKHAVAKKEARKRADTRILIIGAVVAVIGLVSAGMTGVFSGFSQSDSPASALALDTTGAEVVSLEEGASLTPVEHAATDRETQFLGPDNHPDGLSLAEAGQAGQPTLVWFHADW